MILAYAILFFPLALVGVRASVMQAPPSLEEVARSLGQRRAAVLWRVTLPLIGPGLAGIMAECLEEIGHRSTGVQEPRNIQGPRPGAVVNNQGVYTLGPKPAGIQAGGPKRGLCHQG